MKRINPSVLPVIDGGRGRTVKFFTLGCKVNQYETQELRERFLEAGFKDAGRAGKADNYLINTCTVTASADRKSRYLINLALRSNPKARVIVTGCLAQLDSKEIKKIKGVSDIIKNSDKPMMMKLLGLGNCRKSGISWFSGRSRAFLKVQDGCNNRCSYCKVPLVRGSSKSRGLDEIKNEAESLVKNGFQEIVLCGICLGSYGKELKPGKSLADVIASLERIKGLRRIRLSSIEVGDVTPELIKAISGSGKVCSHLHIPLQSGDDDMLRLMNRPYTGTGYLGIINRVRKSLPDIAITTDIIVGFPGEKEENFNNTLKLVKKIMPAKVHIFPYSPRKGTRASLFKGQVDPRIAKERILRLRGVSERCALSYLKGFLGKNLEVFIEGRENGGRGLWIGHTGNYLEVLVRTGRIIANKFIKVRPKLIRGNRLVSDLS